MPNVKIGDKSFNLPVQEVQTRDGKWNQRVVTIGLGDDETLAKVGDKVCSGWQSFVAFFKSCFGSSEKYLADIGATWLTTKGGFNFDGSNFTKVIQSTEIVAKKALKTGHDSQPDSAPVEKQRKKKAKKDGSLTSSSGSDTERGSPTSIQSAPGKLQSQYGATDGSGSGNPLHGLRSRQAATRGSERPEAMRPGDAINAAFSAKKGSPAVVKLVADEQVLARLRRNLDPTDTFTQVRIGHVVGDKIQVYLEYTRGSGSMKGSNGQKTYLIPTQELVTQGSDTTQVSVQIGALLKAKLTEMGLPVVE